MTATVRILPTPRPAYWGDLRSVVPAAVDDLDALWALADTIDAVDRPAADRCRVLVEHLAEHVEALADEVEAFRDDAGLAEGWHLVAPEPVLPVDAWYQVAPGRWEAEAAPGRPVDVAGVITTSTTGAPRLWSVYVHAATAGPRREVWAGTALTLTEAQRRAGRAAEAWLETLDDGPDR